MTAFADLPRAAWCGSETAEGVLADLCADHRVRPKPDWPTTGLACDGGRRDPDGVMVLCSHTCHGLPGRPSTAPPLGGFS